MVDEKRPEHRRGFDIAIKAIGYSGSPLSHWDRELYFDNNQGYNLRGLEHSDIDGCSHCEIRKENTTYHERNLRAGVAFTRYLAENSPTGFMEGMRLWWLGVDPYIQEN